MKIILEPPNLTQEQEKLIADSKKEMFKQEQKEMFKQEQSVEKKSSKKGKKSSKKRLIKNRLLKKPKVGLVKKLNAVSTVMKGGANTRFVKEGRTGYMIEDEMEKEKNVFLRGFSL